MVKHNLCAKITAEILIMIKKVWYPITYSLNNFKASKSNFKQFVCLLILSAYSGELFSLVMSAFVTIFWGTNPSLTITQALNGCSSISSHFLINLGFFNIVWMTSLLILVIFPGGIYLFFRGVKNSRELKYLWKNYKVNVKDEMMQKKLKN